MQGNRGFALVTSLLILLVVAGLGAGAVFLTITNLRIAENARGAMVAQYNAESGLDLALIALSQSYRSDGVLPTLETLRARVPDLGVYTVTELTLDGGDGIVRVRGVGPGGAGHTTGARFRPVDNQFEVDADGDPFITVGFVTNGDIFLPGNGTFDLGMWAGGTVRATGGQSALGVGRVGRAAGDVCQIGRTECHTGTSSPDVGPFSFIAARDQLWGEAQEALRDRGDVRECTMRFDTPGIATVWDATDEVICVGPGVTLDLIGTMTNTYVVGHPDATASSDPDADPVAFSTINLRGDSVPRRPGEVGVKIAAGSVNLIGGTMRGENTVLAVNSVILDKNVTSHDRIARTLIATESDVRLNGGGNRDAFATFRANGNFCFNGTINRFIGSVVTMNMLDVPNPICGQTVGINFAGSITEASVPDDVENSNIPPSKAVETDAAGVRIIARRP